MDTKTFRKLPVNVELISVQPGDLVKVGKISEAQIFDNLGNFHPSGLFSTTVFGAIGSEYRTRMFGYIDLGVTILHPLVYYAAVKLKSLHKSIAEGKVSAVFDEKTREFVKSTEPEAETGYNFFFRHFEKIKHVKTDSEERAFLIDMVERSIKLGHHTLRYALVLPAGLRDYTVDATGKPQEDEINTFYRKLISQSSIVDPIAFRKNPELYDGICSGLQNVILELFEYIKSLLDGKNKLILGKWLSRKIFNSTRNVLSIPAARVDSVDDVNRLKYNECLAGLHQFVRATVPKSTYEIKSKYIKDIFIENSNMAFLTNVKTLKREEVLNTHIQKEYDLWTSSDGIDKVIESLGNLDSRNLPIKLNKGKHYMGLIYRDDVKFKFFQDIDELPEGFDKSKVTPVTLAEFIYISVYHLNGKYPAFNTRYPITGFGSIYPAFLKVITTVESYNLCELDHNWEMTESYASSFPDKNSFYFNSMSVNQAHFATMTADVDGDTLSQTAVLSDDAVNEITEYLQRKEYYLSDSGKLNFSNDTDTLSAVLSYMT